MKRNHFSKLTIAVFTLCLIILFGTAGPLNDAYGRAGRGESYRSSSSSSSRSSYSSDSSWRSRGSILTPSSRESSSPYHYTREYVPGDYEDDFSYNSWSAVLSVNRDGSVNVAETFDVNTHREQKGIARNLTDDFNILMISGLSCPQGHAGYRASQTSALQFAFGYNEKKAAGRHVFTLKYRAFGMVVPSGSGARLQLRGDPDKNSKMKSVTIILPAGTTAQNVKAAEVMTWDRFLRLEKEMPCTIVGNCITVPVNREFVNRLYVTADLAAGSIDQAALRKGLAEVLEKQNLPSISEYRTRVAINPDRTVGREETYLPAPYNAFDRIDIWYDKYFNSAFFPEGSSSENPLFADNRLHLYGFDKKACGKDDFTDGSVCVPLKKSGEEKSEIRYAMWGNFNPADPFFFEFTFPPAGTKWTDRVRFEITFPPFVKKELVKVKLYLARFNGSQTRQLRGVAFEGKWEGNRLTGEYNTALVDNQLLLARIFLPPAGFTDPGQAKKIMIHLSNFWYFNRIICIGTIVLLALLLAGVPVLVLVVIKKRAATVRT
jgi:hypothetical protein